MQSEQSRSDSGQTMSNEIERKPTKGQNRSEGVRTKSNEIDEKQSLALRSRKRRQDAQHSKNTYVPAIRFSRNHSVSRQTRVSARRAPSPVRRTSHVRLC